MYNSSKIYNNLKILQLKDGQFIIGDILTYEEFQKELIIIEDGKKSLTLEVNQKDSPEVNQKDSPEVNQRFAERRAKNHRITGR